MTNFQKFCKKIPWWVTVVSGRHDGGFENSRTSSKISFFQISVFQSWKNQNWDNFKVITLLFYYFHYPILVCSVDHSKILTDIHEIILILRLQHGETTSGRTSSLLLAWSSSILPPSWLWSSWRSCTAI